MEHECSRCSQRFDSSEMVQFDGAWVCAGCKPGYVQLLRQGASVDDLVVARHRKLVVMGCHALLPDRCIKCNAPAEGETLKRRLTWHPQLVYLLLFVNVLVYILVAVLTRKKATIYVPLCAEHSRKRRQGIGIAWAGCVTSIVLMVLGLVNGTSMVLFFCGLAGLLVSLIFGAIRCSTVTPAKIDKEHVRLRGICKAYLDELPDWSNL